MAKNLYNSKVKIRILGEAWTTAKDSWHRKYAEGGERLKMWIRKATEYTNN